uniref:PPIase cyclophilin-type domain-containing protein n=1 Tax=Amorphochlora amoebiformis TaxID=1561963 RepID=A0A7S0GQ22_9EUKA|mmetsp:Transcript_11145/g.17624  ORF Transcript_11145/g.17624 Transcript_11145/m.17624 type:complete len:104 (+) Transcript_11145:2-313(+)
MPSGDNRNIESYGSLFCVSLSNLQFLDRPHLVVGKVLEGLDVIKRISRTGPNPELRLTDSDPRISVQISDAGEEEFSINYMKTDVDDIEREHRRWIEQAQTGK